LKRQFIMEKLSEKIEVEVSEGEINTQIAAISQRQGRRFDRVRDELAKEGGMMNLYVQLRDEKIVDQLIAKAKVTEAAPKPAVAKSEEKSAGAKKRSTKKAAEEPADEDKADDEAPAKKPRAKRTPPKKE
jgi:FKBP-type peptidyl-prolyl cis-trans isomerase (trigger factor)